MNESKPTPPLYSGVIDDLRNFWRPLVATDLLFKAISLVLLAPMAGLLFRFFLWMTGRSVAADTDIAWLLLNPLMWPGIFLLGGIALAISMLEQASLIVICLASRRHGHSSPRASVWLVLTQAKSVLRITTEAIIRLTIIALPFLITCGLIYVVALTKYDINFYLTERPPVFLVAASLIAVLLGILAYLATRKLAGWSISVPLALIEQVAPRDCLKTSHQRIGRRTTKITAAIAVWLAAMSSISVVMTAATSQFALFVIPNVATGSLWTLVTILGFFLALWASVHVGMSILGAISLGSLMSRIYDRYDDPTRIALPVSKHDTRQTFFRWTVGRIIAVSALASVGSAAAGIAAIESVRSDNSVEVTAHRGASGRAPENTLASVSAAIEDETDWVEIDVQESSDGVVIVAHDSDLKKVANWSTKIWDATFDELRSVDIGSYCGTPFSSERIPTLEEVLIACKGQAGVNIELKYYGHNDQLEQRVVNIVEANEMANNIVVMSLKADGIDRIRTIRPDWTYGLLTAVAAGDLTKADADFLAVSSGLATRSFIKRAHNRNKKVHVWTVNDPVTMSTMISRGADNLITDHPAMARRVIQEREAMGYIERALVDLAYRFELNPRRSSK